MASLFDHTFNNMSRIGNDECDKSQDSIQNTNAANYMLDNFRPACPMTSAIEFATNQPYVNFTGSHQVGIGGCNINASSELLLSDITKSKCRISLSERPFVTVPFLGRGKGDPSLEQKLQQGELIDDKKTLSQLSEISYEKYQQVPMLPNIQEGKGNPSNVLESEASGDWVRGGVTTRDLNRDSN
tara:strand:+ start:4590 stop:5144 length:555 start_codon:yes stop_codon:yes gene_type:complete